MDRGLIYHGKGFDIPWVGFQNNMGRERHNTMVRWAKISWLGEAKY